jgi:serine/threonine protein kinase
MGVHKSVTGDQYLVFEFISQGSLNAYLSKNQSNLKSADLLTMYHHISLFLTISGRFLLPEEWLFKKLINLPNKAYLEKKNIVHRDLAARNLLIDDHMNVKVRSVET